MPQCDRTGKFCYETRDSASLSLGRMFSGRKTHNRKRTISKSLKSYKCGFCDYFHLGRDRNEAIKRVCK